MRVSLCVWALVCFSWSRVRNGLAFLSGRDDKLEELGLRYYLQLRKSQVLDFVMEIASLAVRAYFILRVSGPFC